MKRLRYILAGWCLAWLLGSGGALAETVVWSDNFDTNAASRWQASGGWKIGSPTAGPPTNGVGFRAFSGADCASTQKYAYNDDGRLDCINYNGADSLVVPAANLYPRLRFWQWFNFANALGYVEISTNSGGSWTQLSQTYLNVNGGGVWSRPYFDLSGYAGQSVRIAFHFTSGGCCGNGLGWFVDDVEVATGTPNLTFPEGFEFDPKTSDWSEDAGTWQIGRPTSGPGAAYTGTNCAATVLAGNYLNNVDSRLISPPFIVPASNSPAFRFWHWYSFNNALGYVELNNGGITTVDITNITTTTNTTAILDTNLYQLFGALNTNYSTPLYWNPTIGGWTNATRAMGLVNDFTVSGWYYEAGAAPFEPTNFGAFAVDYRSTNMISALSALSGDPTNYLNLQGTTWESISDAADNPVGYFGTNYTYTYTYSTNIVTYENNWTQISPTYEDSSSDWSYESLDLSAYEGQTVEVAFHFTSGGEYAAPGWYVDDLSLAATPELLVPTNQVVIAGDELTVTIYATNVYLPNGVYTFTLLSPPAKMSIATNGVLTWQTASDQPSSTNTITVVAMDNSLPPIGVTNSFVVTVINPFLLTVPPTQTIYAGQTLVVTNYATNEFSPDDSFTFALLSPVLTNMDTNDLASDGVLTWATTTAQRTGTYTNIIQVTDQTSNHSATNSFLVIVRSPPAPVLTVPGTQTVQAGLTLDVFVSATNNAFPDMIYVYTLTNPPAGASINSQSGEVMWMTNPTNKSQTVSFSVVARDTNTPPLSATGKFSVTISPTPRPTLIVPAVATNYSGQQLAISVTATNPVLPDASYTFSLLSASTNLFITNNSFTSAVLTWTNTGIENGVLTWTNNSVAPRTNNIYVQVRDNSSWVNSVTNHFSLIFLPPPRPFLDPPTDETVFVGQTFTSVLVATNPLLPLAGYTFALAANPTNGTLKSDVLTWTNVTAQPGVYAIGIKMTDNSVPPISATNDFIVTVLPLPSQLNLANPSLSAGGATTFQFSITTPWTNSAWRIEAATNLLASEADWWPIYTNLAGSSSLIFTDLLTTNFPQRYYRVVFP